MVRFWNQKSTYFLLFFGFFKFYFILFFLFRFSSLKHGLKFTKNGLEFTIFMLTGRLWALGLQAPNTTFCWILLFLYKFISSLAISYITIYIYISAQDTNSGLWIDEIRHKELPSSWTLYERKHPFIFMSFLLTCRISGSTESHIFPG